MADPAGLARLQPKLRGGSAAKMSGRDERGGRGIEPAPWPPTPVVSVLRRKRDRVVVSRSFKFSIGKQENVDRKIIMQTQSSETKSSKEIEFYLFIFFV